MAYKWATNWPTNWQQTASRPVAELTQKWLHLTPWSSTAQRSPYFSTTERQKRSRGRCAQLQTAQLHGSSEARRTKARQSLRTVRQFSELFGVHFHLILPSIAFHCLLLPSIALSPTHLDTRQCSTAAAAVDFPCKNSTSVIIIHHCRCCQR